MDKSAFGVRLNFSDNDISEWSLMVWWSIELRHNLLASHSACYTVDNRSFVFRISHSARSASVTYQDRTARPVTWREECVPAPIEQENVAARYSTHSQEHTHLCILSPHDTLPHDRGLYYFLWCVCVCVRKSVVFSILNVTRGWFLSF